MKISTLSLSELYGREKITTAVEARIRELEDFTSISKNYCTNVCKLKCKNPNGVKLLTERSKCDVLIVQDHQAPAGKYDRRPGQQEALIQGILFFMLKQAGQGELTVQLTNVLKCAPTETDFPRGKAPTATKLLKCSPYLREEIERLKPKVIISLSTVATKALGYVKMSNTGNRGEVVDNVVITLHPRVLTMIRQNASGAMWGSDYFEVIIRDFRKAFAIARGELVIPDLQGAVEAYSKQILIARSIDDVKEIVKDINALPKNRWLVSVDTETTGLDRYADDAKLLTIQFGYRDPVTKQLLAFVIPLWHRANTMYNADEAWEILVPVLEDAGISKVLHNMKFDYLYVQATTGVRMKGVEFDTMLLLHDIDSGTQGCFSLKTAIWDYAPEIGLGGYEDLLPSLSSKKDIEASEMGEEEYNEESEVE